MCWEGFLVPIQSQNWVSIDAGTFASFLKEPLLFSVKNPRTVSYRNVLFSAKIFALFLVQYSTDISILKKKRNGGEEEELQFPTISTVW